jgi:hypothetical protein
MRKGFIRSGWKGRVPRRQLTAEIIQISVVAAMYRPTIAKDERPKIDERVDTQLLPRSVPEHRFQYFETGQCRRHIEVSAAVMPSLLIDAVAVPIELSTRLKPKDILAIVRASVPLANLLVQRCVKIWVSDSQI